MTEWTPEQQSEHRRLWVEALRSGDYEQTTGALCQVKAGDDGEIYKKYCCLGVACEISGLGYWEEPIKCSAAYRIGNSFSSTLLLDAVREWLGLNSIEGKLIDDPDVNIPDYIREMLWDADAEEWCYGNIADINDELCDFNTIADIIDHAEQFGILDQ